MNVQLLKEVKAHILEEPNRLVMSREVATDPERFTDALDGQDFDIGIVQVLPPCGTAGCIAGWTVMLGHPNINPKDITFQYDIHWEAQSLLGVDSATLDRLYYVTYWPEPFKSEFKTEDLKKRAEVTAARIDHFIETGE